MTSTSVFGSTIHQAIRPREVQCDFFEPLFSAFGAGWSTRVGELGGQGVAVHFIGGSRPAR